jgi:LuxR family transcriptional regulator
MEMNAVLQFLDAERNEEEGAESIRARIRDVISRLGFDYFTLVRQPGPESPASDIMLEGQWPKGWPDLYVKRKYATIDQRLSLSWAQSGRLSAGASRWRPSRKIRTTSGCSE